jgi:hypothetical protein
VHAACSKAEALVLLDIVRVGVQKELPDPGVSNISTSSSSSSAKCHLKHYFSYQQWVLVDKLSS